MDKSDNLNQPSNPEPDPYSCTESPKILIIRFSSIGDIILTTPMVRCLKKRFPKSQIHYLTNQSNTIILENNPYIDKVISYSGTFPATFKQLKAEKYSLVIDSHRKLRSIMLSLRLLRPRVHIRKESFKKMLLVKFRINLLSKKHVVDLHLDTVKHLGVVNDNLGLDYFLSEEDYIAPDALPLNFQDGYIAVVVGAKHFTKQIPTDILIDICNKIQKPILLLGDSNDRIKAESIEKQVGTRVFNGCGVYNLNQSAALIDKSLGVITSDTGLMHIASARKKPIIIVWGNTIPEFGLYPYMPEGEDKKIYSFEVENLNCRPCSRIGYDKCPKNDFKCMLNHNTEKIAEIANAW